MNEEPFTSSGSTTAAAYPGAPHQGGSPLQQKTGHVAHAAQEEAQRLKQAAREQSAAAMRQVKGGVRTAAHQAQEMGSTFVRNQKDMLAERCTDYAAAARAASEKLRAGEGNLLAGPADQAAQQLERASNYLRNHDAADLLEDVESFARRRPEIVFGGLFVLGLAAARFLKASRRSLDERRYSGGYVSDDEISSYRDVDYGSGAGFTEEVASTGGIGSSGAFGAGSSIPSATTASYPSTSPATSSIPPTTGTGSTPLSTGTSTNPGGTTDCGCSTPGTSESSKPQP